MPSGRARGRVYNCVYNPVYNPVHGRGRSHPGSRLRIRQSMARGRFAAHHLSVTVVRLIPWSAAQVRLPGSRVAMVLPLMTLTSS